MASDAPCARDHERTSSASWFPGTRIASRPSPSRASSARSTGSAAAIACAGRCSRSSTMSPSSTSRSTPSSASRSASSASGWRSTSRPRRTPRWRSDTTSVRILRRLHTVPRHARAGPTPKRPGRRAHDLFALGYLVAWGAAGVASFAVAQAGGGIAGDVLAWDRIGRWLAGATLVAAAAYGRTPLKDVCLAKCRSPLGFLLGAWRDGRAGSVQLGVRHGAWCVGCCWALMASRFALGFSARRLADRSGSAAQDYAARSACCWHSATFASAVSGSSPPASASGRRTVT